MTNTLIYLLVSGFTIWFIQSQKIFDYVFVTDFLKELRKCKFCLGFWVCAFYFLVFQVGILDIFIQTPLVFAANWLVTAMVSSFFIFLVFIGWQSHYGITRV